MNDWADTMARRINKRIQDQQFEYDKLLETQRIRRAKGELLWHEVREQLKENCEALNQKMKEEILRFEVGQRPEVTVFTNIEGGRGSLRAGFDADQAILLWECGSKNGKWEVRVESDGSALFARATDLIIPATPSSIANEMLDALLGF